MNILTQIKFWIFLVSAFVNFVSYSQIVIGGQPEVETKQEAATKPAKNKQAKSGALNLDRSQIYLSASPLFTFRSLETNAGLFGKELGERANETGAWVWNYGIGVRSPLNNNFILEIGAMLNRNREAYTVDIPDSVYSYTSTYRHVGIPIKIGYTIGEELSFYCAAGFMPKAFVSQRQDFAFRDAQGFDVEEKEVIRNGYNLFLVDAVMSLGIRFETDQNYGVFLMAEGFYQLNNNYTNQGPFVRRPFGIGLSFGMHFYM